MLTQQEAEKLSQRMEGLSCTNPKASDGLFGFVFGVEQGERQPAYDWHLDECEYCRIALQVYRDKRDAAKLYNKWATAKEIVAQAEADSRVLKRDLGNGTTAYFRPKQGHGTMVIVASSGDFLSVEEQSLESFQHLKSVP